MTRSARVSPLVQGSVHGWTQDLEAPNNVEMFRPSGQWDPAGDGRCLSPGKLTVCVLVIPQVPRGSSPHPTSKRGPFQPCREWLPPGPQTSPWPIEVSRSGGQTSRGRRGSPGSRTFPAMGRSRGGGAGRGRCRALRLACPWPFPEIGPCPSSALRPIICSFMHSKYWCLQCINSTKSVLDVGGGITNT